MCSECGKAEKPLRRGLCGKHYARWRRLNGKSCSIDNCPQGAIAYDYCQNHYRRWKKYGDPLGAAPRGKCAQEGCDREVVVSRSDSGLCGRHLQIKWKKDHPDEVNASNRRYGAGNRAKVSAWQKKWLDANPNYRAEATAVRRARKTSQFVERVYRSVVFKRDQGVCGICGTFADTDDWHLDHVIPLARGGEHSYANTQVSHPACNVKKGARILKESHHQP